VPAAFEPAPSALAWRVRMLSFFRRRSALALAVFVLGLPFAASGACGGGTACFQYTQPEYAIHGNSCPAQQDALPNFSNTSSCPGSIVAVNSAGSFDGEICCYAVTFSDIVPDCGSNGSGQGGFNGGSMGFTSTGFTSSTASVGGAGPPPPSCAPSCVDAITNGGTPCADPGLSVWEALLGCACSGAIDGCAMECSSLCQDSTLGGSCNDCLMMNCASEIATCDNN
jgi:hypothetical protein